MTLCQQHTDQAHIEPPRRRRAARRCSLSRPTPSPESPPASRRLRQEPVELRPRSRPRPAAGPNLQLVVPLRM